MNIDAKTWLMAALGALAVIMLGRVIAKRLRGRLSGIWKKRERVEPQRERVESEAAIVSTGELFGSLTPALAAQLPVPENTRQELQKELRRAGYYRPTALREFNALRFVLVAGTLLLAGVLAVVLPPSRTRPVLVASVVAATLAFSLPRLFLVGQGKRRIQKILAGLPDAIDLINMGVSRGLTFSGALQRVQSQIRDVHPELSQELEIMQQQARLGTLEQALRQLEQRIEASEVRALTSMLAQTERLGTSMAGALETSASSLRADLKNNAERMASSTPFKLLFPVVLCLLPAVYMVMLAPAAVELSNFMRQNSDTFRNRANLTRISPTLTRSR